MDSDPSQRKQAVAMGYVFAAAIGVLVVQWVFTTYNTIETIPYSQFEQLVSYGKVAEVDVGQDSIQGKLKENEKLPSGKQAFVTARVDPQFAEKLAQKGVVVKACPRAD
jgi:cell division protease FtsH